MIALALVLLAAPAQDDIDAAIKELAPKLAREGLSRRLADAAVKDWGVQAIREKIDFLIGARVSRFERDPMAYFEDHLFSTDQNGDLRLYPQHQEEMKRLADRMSRAADRMKDFNRRCDQLVKRIGEASDFDKRARQAWSDPAFRTAFFHRHPAELRELTSEDLSDFLLVRGMQRGRDGKLYVGGPYADELRGRMESVYGILDRMNVFEKAYLQEAAKVKDSAARAAAASDSGILVILGRLLRQSSENSEHAIGSVTEPDEEQKKAAAVSFTLDLSQLAPLVKEAEEMAAVLKAIFEKAATEIASAAEPELNIREFLKNDRARMVLAEHVVEMKRERETKAAEIMAAAVEDGFEEKDGRLHVKKGRYVNEQKEESIDALQGELNAVLEEFNGTIRQDFDRVAERCLDEPIVAMFEDRTATFLLLEHREFVIATLVDAAKKQSLDVFTKTYLSRDANQYVVRPERARRVEAILDRAEEIKKEMQKAAQAAEKEKGKEKE